MTDGLSDQRSDNESVDFSGEMSGDDMDDRASLDSYHDQLSPSSGSSPVHVLQGNQNYHHLHHHHHHLHHGNHPFEHGFPVAHASVLIPNPHQQMINHRIEGHRSSPSTTRASFSIANILSSDHSPTSNSKNESKYDSDIDKNNNSDVEHRIDRHNDKSDGEDLLKFKEQQTSNRDLHRPEREGMVGLVKPTAVRELGPLPPVGPMAPNGLHASPLASPLGDYHYQFGVPHSLAAAAATPWSPWCQPAGFGRPPVSGLLISHFYISNPADVSQESSSKVKAESIVTVMTHPSVPSNTSLFDNSTV